MAGGDRDRTVSLNGDSGDAGDPAHEGLDPARAGVGDSASHTLGLRNRPQKEQVPPRPVRGLVSTTQTEPSRLPLTPPTQNQCATSAGPQHQKYRSLRPRCSSQQGSGYPRTCHHHEKPPLPRKQQEERRCGRAMPASLAPLALDHPQGEKQPLALQSQPSPPSWHTQLQSQPRGHQSVPRCLVGPLAQRTIMDLSLPPAPPPPTWGL